MKAYSDVISGIDVDAVTNSATAGSAVVELANTLPNTGGLVSWFTGDNNIGAFGEGLVTFGENFAQYSDCMKTVDADIVTATTNAATSIVELQKSLPKEGGWFSDDMTLSSFGSDMASFGQHFNTFYGYISGVDTGLLSSIIIQINSLVDMANGMVNLDTSGMSGFSTALTTLGQSGIDGFIEAFNNADSRVKTAATTMLNTFINVANEKKTTLTTAFTTLVQAVLTAISNKYSEFQFTGSECMTKLIAGVSSKDSAVKSAFTNGISGAISSVKKYYSQFYSAGSYLVDGFTAGISDNMYKAEAKARAMAKKAAEAAEDELDEHSPSKRFYGIGSYAVQGFVNALDDYASKAKASSANMAASAVNGLTNAMSKVVDFIEGKLDVEPIIRPVLDLTNVKESMSNLNVMFTRSQALAISAGMQDLRTAREIQNGKNVPCGNSYQFTQNNYSPKSLSRIEIYRQTRNQLSAFERMAKND